MPRLAARERVPELMDDPAIDPAEHRAALAGLARLNRWSGSGRVLWPPIRELARRTPGRPLRVLDVATGSGDIPVSLAARAGREGIPLELAGCDISPTAVSEATAATAGLPVSFFQHDVIRDPLPTGFDVATCSLFLHHLSDVEAVTVLKRLKDTGASLVLVNDLSRSRFNYWAVWAACRLATRSEVVRFDGPASVRSAFTPAEARSLAERAGLTGATVASRFPCRFLLTWSRG